MQLFFSQSFQTKKNNNPPPKKLQPGHSYLLPILNPLKFEQLFYSTVLLWYLVQDVPHNSLSLVENIIVLCFKVAHVSLLL